MLSPDLLGARVNNWLLLVFGGCALLLYFLLPVPFVFLASEAEPFNRWLFYLGMVGGALLGIVAPLYLLTRYVGVDFGRQFLFRRPRLVPSLAVMAATLSLVPALEIITFHASRIRPPSQDYLSFLENLRPDGALEMAGLIVALALAVPLAEELLFRGLLQRVLMRSLPRSFHWLAVIMVALFFAVLHPLFSTPGVFALGLFFGFLTYYLDNLVYAIFAHAVWNMTNLMVLSQMTEGMDEFLENPFGEQEAIWFAGSVVLFALLSALWLRYRERI
jgi:membrane protease YdiL (CAAX protease family)